MKAYSLAIAASSPFGSGHVNIIGNHFKKYTIVRCQWLMPVTLTTWEVEIGRTKVQGQPGQIVLKTPSPK
jgi:hypothetical protein